MVRRRGAFNPNWTVAASDRPVNTLAFGPDGRVLASAGDDAAITLWNPADGLAAETLRRHQMPVRAVTFAGRVLLSGGFEPIPVPAAGISTAGR